MVARSRIAALVVLAVAAGCKDSQRSVAPPVNSFYYPTGVAVRHSCPGGSCQLLADGKTCAPGTPGCHSQLLVASSNFDLQYDALTGGTLLSVDVDQALGTDPNAAAGPFLSGAVLGSARIGSLTGEVAVLDPTTCSDWTANPQVLVASRAQNLLYHLEVDPSSGALSCNPATGCQVPLPTFPADAYGVTVVCGNLAGAFGGSPTPRHLAFVTFLRAQNNEGYLSRVDLDSWTVENTYDVGPGPTHSTAYDPARGLLYMSELFSTVGVARLRWLDLTFPQLGVASLDYGGIVRGAELVNLALSSDSPPSRLYVAARLYDYDTAITTGIRPFGDLGAALLVIDVQRLLSGLAAADTLIDVVHLDRGPATIAVIPKLDASGKPQVDAAGVPLDLVALTSSDDGTMTLYDAELGATTVVFGLCDSLSPIALNRQRSATPPGLVPDPCPDGNSTLGKQPYGLAAEPYQRAGQALERLLVGSFDRDWVNAIVLDPNHADASTDASSSTFSWGRIGPERP